MGLLANSTNGFGRVRVCTAVRHYCISARYAMEALDVVSSATQLEAKGERGKYQWAQAGAITANEDESYRKSIRSIALDGAGAR